MSGLLAFGLPGCWTDEDGEKATVMLQAALSEAGYPCSVETTVSMGRTVPAVAGIPIPVYNRARSLIFTRLGIDFEWCPDCPDTWFSSAGNHWHSTEATS